PLGTARIFVSADSGQSWEERSTTSWADWPVAAVDTSDPSGRYRFFTFFNESNRAPTGARTRVGVLEFQGGDREVRRLPSAEAPGAYRYGGSFPRKVIVQPDGSLAVFYRAALRVAG